jgi:hypothetical protein
MISKIENLIDIRKLKSLQELIIEDNPVLLTQESIEALRYLPIKNKYIPVETETDITSSKQSLQPIIYSNKVLIKQDEITETQSASIINHIRLEWENEYKYIIDNGYNGFNSKRLRESKISSGHVELDGDNLLIIYGNALEVLSTHKTLYEYIDTIHFEYFNIDLITVSKLVETLKSFVKLKKLIFSHNNVHSFYQLIKLEDITLLESITITNNEIASATLLKFFLIYRIQNLKYFNGVEIAKEDVDYAKRIFEFFDKCISDHESIKTKTTTKITESSLDQSNKKEHFYEYVKVNINDAIDELIEEFIF